MKLALIGKNITHSRSPMIYKYLLGPTVQYDLIDVQDEKSLPSVQTLFLNYQGINITTPYKTHYLNEVNMNDEISTIGAINCLKQDNLNFLATNTDYLALRDIFLTRHSKDHIIILGNGVMARICLQLAHELKISFDHLHRANGLIPQFDFSGFVDKKKKTTIINCCGRDFIYEGAGSRKADFWDLNYALPSHLTRLPFLFKSYIDGQELLWKQAQMAIAFWLGKNCSPNY